MSEVSIVKCSKINEAKALKSKLLEAIDLIGGFKTIILKGDTIFIKPNILAPLSYETGATTNPFLVVALIELLKEYGVKKITIGEGSVAGIKTGESFTKTGWDKLAEKNGVKLVDLKKDKFILMSVPDGKVFRTLNAPRTLLDSDIIINIPVMKTHDTYPATLGLKNMKGVIRERDKKRFHLWNLSQSIVDLNKLLMPQLTIEDGTVGMEGFGPMFGTPANLGVIVASFDTVAADTVAAKVMGFEPGDIEYLKLAIQQGLGCGSMNEIEVLGLQVEQVKKEFATASLEMEELKKNNIRIIEAGACSGCRATIEAYIYNMQKEGHLEKIKDYTFLMGQNIKMPKDIKGRIVKFGACTRSAGIDSKSQEFYYIQGCPPHPENTDVYIKNIL